MTPSEPTASESASGPQPSAEAAGDEVRPPAGGAGTLDEPAGEAAQTVAGPSAEALNAVAGWRKTVKRRGATKQGDSAKRRDAATQGDDAKQGDTKVLTIRMPVPRLPGLSRRPGKPGKASRTTGTRAAAWSDAVGRGFARLTVLPAIGVVAWLLPGLPLLLAGEFLPVPELLVAAPLFAALAVNVLHRLPAHWPVDLPGKARDRGWMAWSGALGTAAIAAVFVFWQLALSAPSVIETRTPGTYFQAGYWIAQHGSLPIPASLAAFGGAHPGLHVASFGFYQSGHFVVPAASSGLPMLLAGGFWTSGIGGGAVIGPLLGGLAVLSFGGLVGRLAGRHWAPAGALVLALTLPEIYVSRNAFSEPAVQVLLFGGLSLVIDALTLGHKSQAPEQEKADASLTSTAGGSGGSSPLTSTAKVRWRLVTWPARVRWRTLPSRAVDLLVPERMLAALGGLALGLTSLLSIGSLVYLIAVIVVAGVLLVARPVPGLAFCLGLDIGIGCGIAGGYLLALPYMDSLAPTLEAIGRDIGAAALLTIVAVLVLRRPAVGRFARRALARRPLRWLPGLAGLVVLATIAALAVRPSVQTVRRFLGQPEADFVAALQRMNGLHVDPTRLYSEYTLYWVIWYAGAATVLLGGFGAAVLARRCVRTAVTWRDPSGTGLAWAMPLAVIFGGSAAILWQPFTVPDQPWASRRLVPVVLPGLILLGTWMAAWLTRRARDRGAALATVPVIAALCVGSMLIPAAFTSFGIGLTHSGKAGGLRLTAAGLAQHRVGPGEADAVRGLCAAIGRSSSVLIVDRRVAGEFTEVIRGMCGVPVAWMGQAEPVTAVDAVLGGIVRAGRHPVVLGATSAQVARFGGSPVRVVDLITTQESHELTRQAGPPWPASYVIWMVAAGTSGAGI